MEKRTARLFCGFGTFILLLYTVEVSSAPAVQDIISVMKNDNEICKGASYLYESNYTKDCAKYEYPNNNMILSDYIAISFCLAVYDTSYKVCHYPSHWQNPFDSTTKFDAYIEKSFPDKEYSKEVEFCEKIKGLTPMYNKTKALVLLLIEQLDNKVACLSLCFGSKQEFNPFCAIIAWIKSIDEDMNKLTIPKDTKKKNMLEDVLPVDNSNNLKAKEAKHNDKANPSPTDLSSPKKSADLSTAHNENAKDVEESQLSAQHVSKSSPEKMDKAKPVSEVKVDTTTKADVAAKVETLAKPDELPSNQNNLAIPTSSASTVEKKLPGDTGIASTSKDNTKNIPVNTGNVIIPVQEENQKVPNDDTKTNTISENTQEHEDKTEDETNCNENEKLSYNLEGISEQSFETGDQNHNMPEPSEQRDLPHYHNLNPEDESHLFTYFTIMSLVFIAAYIGYHNKQKILAIVLEGRRSRNNRGRRRPSTASYRKLDCTLEEAVTSQCNANVTHVIY